MTAYLLHCSIALQVTAAHVQRYVRRVYHAMKQRQIFGHYVLHLVRHEHLVAIQLYLVPPYVQIVLYLREIQYSCQVERVIHIQMYVEQRLVKLHRVQLMVELLVVLFRQVRGFPCPCRVDIVYYVVLICLLLPAVFPLFLLAEHYLNRQELAVFLQQLFYFAVLQILLVLLVYVQHYVCSALGFYRLLHLIYRTAVATPVYGLGVFLVAQRVYLHAFRHHEGRIESQSEVTYYCGGVVFVFLHELLCTREGYLVDVLVNLLLCHAYSVVTHGYCLLAFIYKYAHARVTQFSLHFAYRTQCLQFLCRIYCIAYQLTEKYLMV